MEMLEVSLRVWEQQTQGAERKCPIWQTTSGETMSGVGIDGLTGGSQQQCSDVLRGSLDLVV